MVILKDIMLFLGCGGDILVLEKDGFKVVGFNKFKPAHLIVY